MKTLKLLAKSISLLLFVTILFGIPASASVYVLYTPLMTGSQQEPSNPSPGTGTSTFVLDTNLHTLTVSTTFNGLLGPTTQVPNFIGFPLGVTSGTYSNTFDLTLASSYNPAFITANGGTPASAEVALETGILAGKAYLNIHTNVYPGGEIRGFLINSGANFIDFHIDSGTHMGTYDAFEFVLAKPIADLPGGIMTGPTIYVGRACNIDPTIPAATAPDQIAVIKRGYCTFNEKATNAINKGYAGVIIFNNVPGLFTGTMSSPIGIPGVSVDESTGLAIFDKTLAELESDFQTGNLVEGEHITVGIATNENDIPEFPTVALPVIAVIGLMFLFQRRKVV